MRLTNLTSIRVVVLVGIVWMTSCVAAFADKRFDGRPYVGVPGKRRGAHRVGFVSARRWSRERGSNQAALSSHGVNVMLLLSLYCESFCKRREQRGYMLA